MVSERVLIGFGAAVSLAWSVAAWMLYRLGRAQGRMDAARKGTT